MITDTKHPTHHNDLVELATAPFLIEDSGHQARSLGSKIHSS